MYFTSMSRYNITSELQLQFHKNYVKLTAVTQYPLSLILIKIAQMTLLN